MTTLHVILDDMLTTAPGGAARYADELATALVRYAPAGCFVEGIVASSTEEQYGLLEAKLPGLTTLFKSALVRRDLTTAWQHGFTPVPTGMLHAPSLFAPLRNHDRLHEPGNQIVVTMHDAVAWSHPEYLSPREVSWTKAMANRAVKYADAVVVPTHAVADELDALLGFGDRLRVLNGAVSSRIARPDDAAARVTHLELPDRYLATVGNSGAQHGIGFLLAALAAENATTLPLVVVGTEREPGALAAAIAESGLDPRRVVGVGPLDDEDYSSVLAGAVAMIYPGIGNGFGTPMLEAMALGTPVVHAATPSLIEVAGESGVSVPFSDPGAYPGLLAEAIDRVAEDQELRTTLSILGLDRARLFTWRAAAEGVWQLHADL